MRKDDLKLIFSLVATALLASGVIYSSYRRDLRQNAGPIVDLPRIEKLVDQGSITLHDASYWEPVKESRP